jgi:hypothetical protein
LSLHNPFDVCRNRAYRASCTKKRLSAFHLHLFKSSNKEKAAAVVVAVLGGAVDLVVASFATGKATAKWKMPRTLKSAMRIHPHLT